MSVSYTEVPTAQEVLPSAGQVQGTGVRFNGEGGVRKEWWWQAGPVDSCCFCCSLRAGVAILATIDLLLNGIYGTFYQQEESEKMFHDLLAQLKMQYSRMCSGTAAASLDCVQLAHTIEQLEDEIDLFNHLPITFYIQGVIAILAGVAGLVAVFNSSALAAKWYLWTWAPRCLAMVVTQVVLYAKQGKYGIDRNPAVFALSQIFSLFLTVYYIKVVWSYSKRLGYRGSNPSSSASQAVQIGQPSAGYDGV